MGLKLNKKGTKKKAKAPGGQQKIDHKNIPRGEFSPQKAGHTP